MGGGNFFSFFLERNTGNLRNSVLSTYFRHSFPLLKPDLFPITEFSYSEVTLYMYIYMI